MAPQWRALLMRWRSTKTKSSKVNSSTRPHTPADDEPRRQRPAAASGTLQSSQITQRPDGRRAPKKEKKPKLSRLHRPADMSLEDWQIELRPQFGREQDFRLSNLGEHPIFSKFDLFTPQPQN